MPTLVPRKGYADLVRLAAVLQQLGRGAGVEGPEVIAEFLHGKGIDILKDAASIPGVIMHYLLRGTAERGAELWTPGKEAYEMLRGAVVGGPSIVFTRHHEVGETNICSHQVPSPHPCWKIVGYDTNALYLSTMLQEMPCGKERVMRFEEPAREAPGFTRRLQVGAWFGFAEVDIEISKPLWPKFEELCPFFVNQQVPTEVVPQHMLD